MSSDASKNSIATVQLSLKFGFVGLLVYVLFSLCREKSTKRAPLKEETHGFFLKYPSSYCAHFFRQWAKEVDRAQGRQDPKTRTNGGAPSARSSPLCFRPKSFFNLSDNEKPWVATKRTTNRAVGTLPTVRLYGELRLNSALAILPTGKMAR